MSVSTVSIVKCAGYDPPDVQNAIASLLSNCEAELSEVRPGMTVLIKANIGTPSIPERAATTHPNVVVALAKELLRRGAKVVVGDDPIAPIVSSETMQLSGMQSALSSYEVSTSVFAIDQGFEWVETPNHFMLQKVRFSKAVLNADYVINVPKLKTHILTQLSCAVKNYMGCIERTQRKEIHKFNSQEGFAGALIDIYQVRPANLTVVDGIIGMAGLGPSNGIPVKTGVLMSSTNAYATDYCAAEILGYNPNIISTVAYSKKLNLFNEQQIHYPLLRPSECRSKNLSLPPLISDAVRKRFAKHLSVCLHVDESKCVQCGECISQCPAKAISGSPPDINFNKCLMCFCCFELCPQSAIEFMVPSILGHTYTLSKSKMYEQLENGNGV